jgi:chemotaxis protein MotB
VADDDAPPGVPEWVVTYGDMMSLLLTFFIMLVSLSEVQANKKFRAVLDSLQKSLGYTAAPLAPPGGAFPLNSVIERMSILGAHTNERTSKGGIKTPQATRGDDVRIFSNRPGNPISAGAPLLFARGSSELVPTVQKELVDFAARLAGKPNKIEVFGHDIPDSADGGTSAWNLAYERARRVADFLIKEGIDPDRIRLLTHIQMPDPNLRAARPSSADSVEIFLLDAFQNEYVGPRVP